MKNSDEFRAAAQRLLDLVDAEGRGEISTYQLLYEWKKFRRISAEYFKQLEKQMRLN